jgi:hypothetical protein
LVLAGGVSHGALEALEAAISRDPWPVSPPFWILAAPISKTVRIPAASRKPTTGYCRASNRWVR